MMNSMNEREFKVGDRVAYIGEHGRVRPGYTMGLASTVFRDREGELSILDADGDERPFFDDEWKLVEPGQEHQRTPAQVARMEALVRRMVEQDPALYWRDIREEARVIVAEIDPVDGDLVEAREVVMQVHLARGFTNTDRTELDRGDHDNEQPVLVALAALKRGRELQKRGEG